jgi:hypothetical protein
MMGKCHGSLFVNPLRRLWAAVDTRELAREFVAFGCPFLLSMTKIDARTLPNDILPRNGDQTMQLLPNGSG